VCVADFGGPEEIGDVFDEVNPRTAAHAVNYTANMMKGIP
jgi:hypothetical protein